MSIRAPINLGVLAGARIPHWVPPHNCDTGPAWEETSRPSRTALSMAYLNGVFVSANRSNGGADQGTLSYAADGRNWTETAPLPVGGSFSPTQVLFGNGIYLAMTDSSVVTIQAPAVTGLWVAGTSNPNVLKSNVLGGWFGGGLFVQCAAVVGQVFSSPNASNQVTHATPAIFNTGIYDAFSGLHFGCEVTSGKIYSSLDLDAWVLRGTTSFSGGPVSTKRLVSNGTGRLIAIDGDSQRNYVSYSHDAGVTWHNSTGLPIPVAFYVDLLYVSHLRIWLLTNNHGRVFISFDDGVTWAQTASDLNFIMGNNINWSMASTPEGFLYAAVPITLLNDTHAAVGIC